jgi:DNA-binding response OmpR family regulator
MPTSPNSKAGPELLIIDDRMESVALLLRYFQGQPVGVMVALNGHDGLRKAQLGQPDVILLDVSMPQMDGFDVCRKLKSDPLTAHIPVLFLSGNVSIDHKLQGFSVGAVDYIVKPFSSEEVLARVYVHFKRQHLEAATPPRTPPKAAQETTSCATQ